MCLKILKGKEEIDKTRYMEVWEARSVTCKECGIGRVVVNESQHSRQRLYTEPYLFCEGWRPKRNRYLRLTTVLRLCRK